MAGVCVGVPSRCDNFPTKADMLGLAGLYWYVIFSQLLAGVRVGVSYSPAPVATVAGEVECALSFLGERLYFGENSWFYPVFRHFLNFFVLLFVY